MSENPLILSIKPIFFITVVAALSFLPGLGTYPMLDPADSLFMEAAREMSQLKHYITPLLNYVDWLDKPALPFLLIVACYKIVGTNEWAGRLPAALSGIVLVVYTYWSTAKILGQRCALISAVILSASPLFLGVGHVALSDGPLAAFFGVAMLSFAQALICLHKKSLPAAYGSLALAILCKGPIALVLSAGIIVTYLIISSQSLWEILERIKTLKIGVGLLVLIAGCLPYYALAHATTHGAFTYAFFLQQNIGRFVGTVNHQEPFWWYLPIFIGGFFPWTVCLLTAGPWFKSIWNARKSASQENSFLLFLSVWVLFILALFSAIPTKLPTYIVGVSPGFAIITAAYLQHVIDSNRVRPLLITLPILLISAGLGFISLKWLMSSHFQLNLCTWTAAGITLSLLILYAILLIKASPLPAVSSLIAAAYLGCALLVPLLFCQFYEIHQAGLNCLIKIAIKKNGHLATLFSPIPSAIFLCQRPITNLNSLSEIDTFCKNNSPPLLLIASKNCLHIPELNVPAHTLAAANNKWYLISLDSYLTENSINRQQ